MWYSINNCFLTVSFGIYLTQHHILIIWSIWWFKILIKKPLHMSVNQIIYNLMVYPNLNILPKLCSQAIEWEVSSEGNRSHQLQWESWSKFKLRKWREKKEGKNNKKVFICNFSRRPRVKVETDKWQQISHIPQKVCKCANYRVGSLNTLMFVFAAFSVDLGNLS